MADIFADQRAELIARNQALQTDIKAILPLFSSESDTYGDLQTVLSYLARADAFLMQLPTQWTKACWILRYSPDVLKLGLSESFKFIKVQFHPKIATLTDAQREALEPVLVQAQTIFSLFLQLDDAQRALTDLPIGVYLVETLIEFLDIILRFSPFPDHPVRVMPPPPTGSIGFQPALVFDLLKSLCFNLMEATRRTTQEPLTIGFQPSEAGFALSLTIPGFHLRPDHWELLRRYDWDYQQEMGGTIEPLTWDEGEGQGIIVLLPWARREQEPLDDDTFAAQRADLIARNHTLQADVEAILPLFSTETETFKHLKHVITSTIRADDLLTSLPMEWATARWILRHEVHEFRMALGENQKRLEIQFLPQIVSLTETQHKALLPTLIQAQTIFSLFLRLDDALRALTQLPIDVYPVEMLIEFLDVIQRFSSLPDHPVRVIVPPLLPSICCQPVLLFDALSHLCSTLRWIAQRITQEQLIVRFQPNETELVVLLAVPGFHLMPAQWERLDHYDWEYQQEMGGSIEPLTWDDGYGQGVIVRLPWAGA